VIKRRSEVQQQTQQPVPGPTSPAGASAPGPGPSSNQGPPRTAAPATAPATPPPAGDPPKTSQTSGSIVAEGDEVTVCYGVDKYSPVQYNNFEHGPFFVKTKVRAGETHGDAGARAWNAALGLAKGSYPGKAQEYLENLKKLGIIITNAGGQVR